MAPLEALSDLLLAALTIDELKATLRHNGVDPRALQIEGDSFSLAHFCADGLLNGLCADCPVCSMAALHLAAGRIACSGSIAALSRCPYRAPPAAVRRYRFELPPALEHAPFVYAWTGEAPPVVAVEAVVPPPDEPPAPPPKRPKRAAPPAKTPASKTPALLGKDGKPLDVGSRALGGLALGEAKPHSAASAAAAAPLPPPPRLAPPEPGCPLLEVHRGFKQSGAYHQARVLVDDDGVTVRSRAGARARACACAAVRACVPFVSCIRVDLPARARARARTRRARARARTRARACAPR
jgi:hypothetical protein